MRPALALAISLSATVALGDVPAVVTDTPVVHSLVAQVMGDLGAPAVLLGPGADPHSFQLRPSQARALAQADVVFWVGEDLTPWLARALETLAGSTVTVPLLRVDGVRLLARSADGHEEGTGGPARDDRDHGDIAHGDVDPHAWLDPENAQAWVLAIAGHLAKLDPENADRYADNAAATTAGIAAMSGELADQLTSARHVPIVTFHDAYSYLASAFGLDIAGSIALGDAAAPGARRLRTLQRVVGEKPITCVFREPQHDASIAEAIARDAGAALGTLDPEGSTLPYGPDHYEELMRGLATSISDCTKSAR